MSRKFMKNLLFSSDTIDLFVKNYYFTIDKNISRDINAENLTNRTFQY